MRCPFCGRILENGPCREYETLLDHVSDPNAEAYPLRPTSVCDCPQAEGKFWDEYGDSYGSGSKDAIGSSAHRFHLAQRIAGKVKPFCHGEYPYDRSYRVAKRLVDLAWPIWPALVTMKKRIWFRVQRVTA